MRLAFQASRGVNTFVAQHFDRHAPVGSGVPPFIHFAHTTRPHPRADLVRAAAKAGEPALRGDGGGKALNGGLFDEIGGACM